MLLLSTYNDSIFLLLLFLCGSLAPIQITRNNSKESEFKPVSNLGWMEMMQKGGKWQSSLSVMVLCLIAKRSTLFWHDNLSLVTAAFSLRANKQPEIQCIVQQARQIWCSPLLSAFGISGISMDNHLVTPAAITSQTVWVKFNVKKVESSNSTILSSAQVHCGLLKLHDCTTLTLI